jgi:predicted TIM-barrel fold metal-dependent hydrolase
MPPVIDAHTHWRGDTGFVSARFFTGQTLAEPLNEAMLQSEQVQRRVDPDGSKLIAMMESAGVDITVTCPVDYAYILGEATRDIEDINAQYPELVKKYPGKIVYMCGVEPRRPNAEALFRKALTEWGAKGLKLHPTTGFLPNDEACHPLYRLASEYGVPVLFHQGPSRMKARFAHPFYVDDVAADFPDLKIWLGHTGGEWWRDAMTVIRTKRNCYAELAGWQNRAANNLEQFVKDLGDLRNAVGAERILYGTDWPAGAADLGAFVKTIKSLPEIGPRYGVNFTQEEADAILGGNTARQLGISE